MIKKMIKKKTIAAVGHQEGRLLILETPHLLGDLGKAEVSWGSASHLVGKKNKQTVLLWIPKDLGRNQKERK